MPASPFSAASVWSKRSFAYELIVPMKPDSVHSPGVQDKLCAPDPISGRSLNFWEFPKWIIELVADNGLIGLGEPRRGDLLSRHFGQIQRLIQFAVGQ